MDSTEDKSQEETMAENKRTSENKAGTDSTDTEKSEKKIIKKISEPSSDKSGSGTQTETERTKEQDSKKRTLQLSSSDDIKLRKHNPKDMKITLPESTRDDRIFSIMYASHEEGRIPRKKPKKKVLEPLVATNKVTKDPDEMKEDDNVGISNEGTKKTPVCVTTHRTGLTPPPYNNKQD